VEQVGAAAQARGARLDQPEHQLGRDHRVDRVAAAPQRRETRVHRERMRRGDHLALGVRDLLRSPAARRLRLRYVSVGECAGEKE
jgi:hypothetical protein